MPFQTEAELLAALQNSDFWKYTASYLSDRREALFVEQATSTEALWKNRGAIEEVTRLFHLPNLLLAKMAMQAQQARDLAFNRLDPDREEQFDG